MTHAELVLGNIFVRPNVLERVGDKVDGHQHNFDHVTFFTRGRMKVTARRVWRTLECTACAFVEEVRQANIGCSQCGKPTNQISMRAQVLDQREFTAFSFCLIKADVEHEIVALESDSQFFCVYGHRDAQGRITQEFTGWSPAYF